MRDNNTIQNLSQKMKISDNMLELKQLLSSSNVRPEDNIAFPIRDFLIDLT